MFYIEYLYNVVLLCFGSLFVGNGRKQTKSDEMAELWSSWREWHDDLLRPWMRLSPLILQTPSRESLPLHASRVRTSPPGPNRAQWRPTSFEWSESLYKEVPCHNQRGGIQFPPDSNQLESRDQERRARLEIAWRGSQGVKIARSSRIDFILQAWSCFVLSLSLLFFSWSCVSRSLSF